MIFHVFNSDFVEENIKPKHYTPDGNIEGYILGKTHIDLTEEKRAEKAKESRLNEINKAIDKLILDAQEELRTKGVKSSTIEYGLIERSQLRNKKEFEKLASFDEIVEQLAVLSKVPENLPDVQAPILSVNQTVSEEVAAVLKTAYPKTEWDEEFVEYYKTHRQFILWRSLLILSKVLNSPRNRLKIGKYSNCLQRKGFHAFERRTARKALILLVSLGSAIGCSGRCFSLKYK